MYKKKDLVEALESIEHGKSNRDVMDEYQNLNKSIITREIRKRKNIKCKSAIAEYKKAIEKEYQEMIIKGTH